MARCFVALFPESIKTMLFLAGLLTYSVFECLPCKNAMCIWWVKSLKGDPSFWSWDSCGQWLVAYSKSLVWNLQQRVCPGFAPGSLFNTSP